MDNSEKLLRAWLKCEGYEVEEVKEALNLSVLSDTRTLVTVDYKVTKKEPIRWYAEPIKDFGESVIK